MKLVVGLGSIEEYIPYVEAGADECFVGYVPNWYYEKYGNLLPANRREVSFYHVQIHAKTDMKILHKMVTEKGVPVSVAWNALYYSDQQKEELAREIQELACMGFDRVILSDVSFLQYLKDQNIHARVEISGELGEINSETVTWMLQKYGMVPGIARVIFQRKTSLYAMKKIIENAKKQEEILLEWEAFLMNENCQFSGGYCNSMHCDEMVHMCLMPYELRPVNDSITKKQWEHGCGKFNEIEHEDLPGDMNEEEEYVVGESGCGLCALWQLREAGVTHLKLVGRGLSPDCMIKDIKETRKALEILETSQNEEEYLHRMKRALFPEGCSRNCYYV